VHRGGALLINQKNMPKKDKKSKEVVKQYDKKDILSIADDFAELLITPNKLISELIDLMPSYGKANKSKKEAVSNKLLEIIRAKGLQNHYSLAEVHYSEYKIMVVEMCKSLVEEYKCQTPSEIMLVHNIVGAYMRILKFSEKFNDTLAMGHTTALLNPFLSIMGKEIDRANRHFITALETLRQIKQPQIKLNVKANNAFVGQNQQFNHNQKKSDEAIEPK